MELLRDEINDDENDNNNKNNNNNNNNNSNILNNKITISKSFKYKIRILGSTPDDGNRLNAEVVLPLKYLSNIWRSVDLPLTVK